MRDPILIMWLVLGFLIGMFTDIELEQSWPVVLAAGVLGGGASILLAALVWRAAGWMAVLF